MDCPVCSNQLSSKAVGQVNLDVCDNGCGGIWFDQFEFKKFDESLEPDAETLLSVKITQAQPAGKSDLHDCPKCGGVKMMRHFASVKRGVVMDQCPMCAGVWLDAGELTAIRNEFGDEESRKRAALSLFDEIFGEALKQQKMQTEENLRKSKKFANALKFILPSAYLPGKQKGGAF